MAKTLKEILQMPPGSPERTRALYELDTEEMRRLSLGLCYLCGENPIAHKETDKCTPCLIEDATNRCEE